MDGNAPASSVERRISIIVFEQWMVMLAVAAGLTWNPVNPLSIAAPHLSRARAFESK